MFKRQLKAFSTSVKLLVPSLNPSTAKMVRYFPNPYEDYKSQADVQLVVEKADVIPLINEHVANIAKRLQPSRNNVEGGLYIGISGVAFMFYKLSKNPLLSESRVEYLDKGVQYLQPALEKSAGDNTSFLLGDAGTYALATVLYKEVANKKFEETLEHYQNLYGQYMNPKFLKCGGDELFVGRAGYLAGALWLQRELQTQVLEEKALFNICDMIVLSGAEYSQTHNSPCPLMYHYYNVEYLGAAHGVSTILQMLLSVTGYLSYNKKAADNIKATTEFVLSLQTDDGNFPCCMEELSLSDHKLVHWCHGAPGTIYLMARAYLVYKEDKYLNACIKVGEVIWQKGLLRKGPGICHGVAGNGYVFLLLYRLTGEQKHLYRAKLFADFMNTDEFLHEARLPDNPQSLYEGTAGTLCFLSDLLVPDVAEFPFQDVFSY